MGNVPKKRLRTCISFILMREKLTPDICPNILGTPCIFLMRGTTFHTRTKHQAKLYFTLSQYLHHWIAKCRHQIEEWLQKRGPKMATSAEAIRNSVISAKSGDGAGTMAEIAL